MQFILGNTAKLQNKISKKNFDIMDCYTDSETKIKLDGNILLENKDGFCMIRLPRSSPIKPVLKTYDGDIYAFPTEGGVLLKCTVKEHKSISFIIDVGESHLKVKQADKSFALMRERFLPYVVFSNVSNVKATGNIISTAKIAYRKLTDKRYMVTVSADSTAQYILLKVILYENDFLKI